MRVRKLRREQQGMSILIVLMALFLTGAIAIAIWYVVTQNMRSNDSSSNKNTSSNSQRDDGSDASSPTTMYQSIAGDLTLYYPKTWQITGYKAGQKVEKLDGEEDTLQFQSAADNITIDNFGVTLTIGDDAPGDKAWPEYPNGKIVEELGNGIDVWEDNQHQTWAEGQRENTCPRVRSASNDAFGYQLKNGKWLMMNGTFCWRSGLTSSLSYNQQRDSAQFAEAIRVLRTIVQN